MKKYTPPKAPTQTRTPAGRNPRSRLFPDEPIGARQDAGSRAPPAAGGGRTSREKEEVELPACSSQETHPRVAPRDVWSIFIVSLCNPCHLGVALPGLEFCEKRVGYFVGKPFPTVRSPASTAGSPAWTKERTGLSGAPGWLSWLSVSAFGPGCDPGVLRSSSTSSPCIIGSLLSKEPASCSPSACCSANICAHLLACSLSLSLSLTK
ncbi:calcineurin B homologous protein 1 isoform X1 [Canis lupus dingo]|uniref:calcineurin B homologous protein 1 isoform X1 n=1 Tax=Canis lupus dingo TaxID=286419 RepID=UPI0020C3885E|nr:calcineurin B homologous protein 1 isoform X1 [Canis lupus dingo]